jgi:hypothetical protein
VDWQLHNDVTADKKHHDMLWVDARHSIPDCDRHVENSIEIIILESGKLLEILVVRLNN